jgi:mRNA interferase HigB
MLHEFSRLHPDAAGALGGFYKTASRARWDSLNDVRRIDPHADAARVRPGNWVTIFNINGNKYQLVASIHYNRQKLFLLKVLTHKEYSTNRWKETL